MTRNAVLVVGLWLSGLGSTGCLTTRSDHQTLWPVVRAIVPRPGGIEVIRCAVTHVFEEKQDFCLAPMLAILTMSHGGGSWSYTNDYLKDENCSSTFIYLGDAS